MAPNERTSPTDTLAQGNRVRRRNPSRGPVGEHLPAEAPAAEHERYIAECESNWRTAYQRFEATRNHTDRDEALLWLHRMNEAILARPAGVQALRHAVFEQGLAGDDRVVPLRRPGEVR